MCNQKPWWILVYILYFAVGTNNTSIETLKVVSDQPMHAIGKIDRYEYVILNKRYRLGRPQHMVAVVGLLDPPTEATNQFPTSERDKE